MDGITVKAGTKQEYPQDSVMNLALVDELSRMAPTNRDGDPGAKGGNELCWDSSNSRIINRHWT